MLSKDDGVDVEHVPQAPKLNRHVRHRSHPSKKDLCSQVAVCPGGVHIPPHYTVIPRAEARERALFLGTMIKCPGCGEKVRTERWTAERAIQIMRARILPSEQARERFKRLLSETGYAAMIHPAR